MACTQLCTAMVAVVQSARRGVPVKQLLHVHVLHISGAGSMLFLDFCISLNVEEGCLAHLYVAELQAFRQQQQWVVS